MKTWLVRLLPAILIVCFAMPANAIASTQCTALWSNIGSLREINHSLPKTAVLPDDGVVTGFIIKSLHFRDGTRFVPRNLEESNCYLDRVLQKKVRDALTQGAASALRDHSGDDPEELLDLMSQKTDELLDRMFIRGGMHPGTGMSALLSYLESDYELKGYERSNVGPLEKQAFSLGIYWKIHETSWLWVSYVQHLGVKGFDSEYLTKYLRALDISSAPPATLSAVGCDGGIEYRWPSVSTPIRTFADLGDDFDVHWGICKTSGELWVYYHFRGWQKVPDPEKSAFCEQMGRKEPFEKICP